MATESSRDGKYVFLVYAVLILAIVIAFEPLRHNKFVQFDDDHYITENAYVKGGITLNCLAHAFIRPHYYMYHPLTTISHILDCQLFGLNPSGHHLVSLLLHIANTVLLFWVFKRITASIWCSAFVAAVFALHPLSVESVAWASERKNVLSTFFVMLTIAAYIRYLGHPRISRYLLVLLMFCLGLLAKPIVVTLPLVLLLLDYWPLGRFELKLQTSQRAEEPKSNYQKKSIQCLILEKVPLFILAAILSIITYLVQQSGRVVVSAGTLPVSIRIANAAVSYIKYIGKMAYPANLAMYYPYHRPSSGLVIICLVILVAVSAIVIYFSRRQRYLLVGWLWYLITLVPVIGLVQVGSQAMADRYTYLSSIGILIMVAWGCAELFGKWKLKKVLLSVASGIILISIFVCTRIQIRYWQDSFVMFEHTLAVTQDNYIMHKLYGDFLRKKGLLQAAVGQYDKALQISPRFLGARENKGLTFIDMAEFDKAIAVFTNLLSVREDWPEVHDHLAVAYTRTGNLDKATEHFKKALQLKGDWPEVWNDLGTAYRLAGEFDLAIRCHQKALQLRPDYPAARYNLAITVKLKEKSEKSGGKRSP